MYSGGSGTLGDPYLIANVDDLKDIENNMSAYFKQTQDITLGIFEPIGWNGGNDTPINFTGIYDGDNHKIQDGIIDYSGAIRVGIFRKAAGATIKNLLINNVKVTCKNTGAILVGITDTVTTIFNVHIGVNCFLNNLGSYGGSIVGMGSATLIENCSNASNMFAAGILGGIIGQALTTSNIKNCYNKGNIGSNGDNVAGIVGSANDTSNITNCLNVGNIHGSNYLGGITGGQSATATTSNCYVANCIMTTTSGGHTGRIISTTTGILNNNFAIDTMPTTMNIAFGSKTPTGKDGQDITSQNLKKKIGYINSGWSFIESGGYWCMTEDATYPYLTSSTAYEYPTFSGGSGTFLDPFLIANIIDFKNIELNMVAYYKQTANITLGNFEPLCWYGGNNGMQSFLGNYNGNNYAIQDGTINYPSNSYVGIWRTVSGTIKNIQLKNIDVVGYNDVGVCAGWCNNHYLENIHVDSACSVIGYGNYTGGIVGKILGGTSGLHTNACSNKAKIIGYGYVGGIAGTADASDINNCYNEGEIYCVGNYAGGITGGYYGSTGNIQYCYNTGNITGVDYCGGISGYTYSYIKNCYAFNASITRISGVAQNFGRVTGYQRTGYLGSNNYANDEMKIMIPETL